MYSGWDTEKMPLLRNEPPRHWCLLDMATYTTPNFLALWFETGYSSMA